MAFNPVQKLYPDQYFWACNWIIHVHNDFSLRSQDEMSYDRFFIYAQQIYRMEPHWVGPGEDSHWAATPGSLLPEIVHCYPEIVSTVKIHKPYQPLIFVLDDKRFQETGVLYADSSPKRNSAQTAISNM